MGQGLVPVRPMLESEAWELLLAIGHPQEQKKWLNRGKHWQRTPQNANPAASGCLRLSFQISHNVLEPLLQCPEAARNCDHRLHRGTSCGARSSGPRGGGLVLPGAQEEAVTGGAGSTGLWSGGKWTIVDLGRENRFHEGQRQASWGQNCPHHLVPVGRLRWHPLGPQAGRPGGHRMSSCQAFQRRPLSSSTNPEGPGIVLQPPPLCLWGLGRQARPDSSETLTPRP